MEMFYYAHSGLRYLVLIAAVLAIVASAMAMASKTDDDKLSRVSMTAFVGLLDLQVLLGIILVIAGIFYPALMGHLVMMVLAAVAAHAASAIAKRREDVAARNRIRLMGAVLALVFIIGGIMSIGRSLFSSAPPSIGI